MALYTWTGYTETGKPDKGMTDASSLREAKLKLRSQGIFVSTITEETSGKAKAKKGTMNVADVFGRVKQEDVAVMTRQLSTLVSASIPLVEALSAMYEQIEEPVLKKTMARIRDSVNEGAALADALALHKKIFPDLYINMVRSGEASGALDVVLLRLAEFLEGQRRLKAKVGSAMIYPLLLLVFALSALTFLMVTVVPKMVGMFESMHQKLPLITRMLISLSGFLAHTWWIIIILIGVAVYLVSKWRKTPAGAMRYDKMRIRMPIYGKLAVKIATARFARTLGTLLSSGVPIIDAMRIVEAVVQNKVMEAALEEACVEVIEGESLAGSLKKSQLFPPIVIHMIEVGERSGTLEDMLIKCADAYEEDVSTAVAGLTSVLEPIMIIFMGVSVGFIIMAILFPMLEMSQIVK